VPPFWPELSAMPKSEAALQYRDPERCGRIRWMSANGGDPLDFSYSLFFLVCVQNPSDETMNFGPVLKWRIG